MVPVDHLDTNITVQMALAASTILRAADTWWCQANY